MKQHTIIGLSLWLASVALSLSIDWRDGDRVVLLGNTFVERAQSYGHLETALAALGFGLALGVRGLLRPPCCEAVNAM